MDLAQIASLVKLLVEHPRQAEQLAEQHPEELAAVMGFAQSPFFQFTPFGTRQDPSGGQIGALRSLHKDKWLITGNRCGKTLLLLYEDIADCLLIDPFSYGPTRRFDAATKKVMIWTVSDTEEKSIDTIQRTLVRDLLGEDIGVVASASARALVGGLKPGEVGDRRGEVD